MPEARSAAVKAAMRETGGPLPGDPVSELLMAQLANPPPPPMAPETPFVAVDLGPKMTEYRFRSKGRYRGLGFHIPVPSDADPDDERLIKVEARAFKRRTPDGPTRAKLVKLAERHGSRHVNFTPIEHKFQCYFNTDDADLADWLRSLPDFGVTFVEEMGPMKVPLPDGTIINVIPQTDADRQAVARARAAQ